MQRQLQGCDVTVDHLEWRLSLCLPKGFLAGECGGGTWCGSGTGSERSLFPQVRRPLGLPLQPLVPPGSPRHQPARLSPPPQEEGVTENRFAEPLLQDKLSSHSLDTAQQPPLDQSLPATHPHLKTHVGDSVSDCVLFVRQVCVRLGGLAAVLLGGGRVQRRHGDLSGRHAVTPLGALSAGTHARSPPAATPISQWPWIRGILLSLCFSPCKNVQTSA